MAFFRGPNTVTDGLILALDAASPKSYPGSGALWTDLAKNQVVSLTNGPTFDTSNNGSIHFDGVNDYCDTGLTGGIYNPNSFTLDIWFKINTLKSTYGICGRLDNTFSQGVIFYGSGANVYFTVNQYNQTLTSSSITPGVIYNFQCSYDGSTLRLYKDGLLVSSVSYSSTVTYNSLYGWNVATNLTGVSLGLAPDMNCYAYKVYGKALSSLEVLQNYNAQKSRFGL